jgi:hypothetical protein
MGVLMEDSLAKASLTEGEFGDVALQNSSW